MRQRRSNLLSLEFNILRLWQPFESLHDGGVLYHCSFTIAARLCSSAWTCPRCGWMNTAELSLVLTFKLSKHGAALERYLTFSLIYSSKTTDAFQSNIMLISFTTVCCVCIVHLFEVICATLSGPSVHSRIIYWAEGPSCLMMALSSSSSTVELEYKC